MEVMEIILLIAGGIIFVLSFLIPDRKGAEKGLAPATEEEIRELAGRELEAMRGRAEEMVEETVSDSMEKTKRSLERLSNEKIMAVNEYSDTVLTQINKDHEEAVFLYDMLNNKHTSLKNTLAELNNTIKAAEELIQVYQQIKPETFGGTIRSGETVPGGEDAGALLSGVPEPEGMPGENPAGQGIWEENGQESFDNAEQKPEKENAREYNNNQKIRKLYREGKSAVVIAKELGLGIGEVSLVIDLFRKQP